MSRRLLRVGALSSVLLWAIPASSSGGALRERQEVPRRLVLQWCDPHGVFEHGSERTRRNLSKLFGALGVELLWWSDASDHDSSEPNAMIRVVLVRSEPSAWNLAPRAMGAVLSQKGPQREVYVFFNPVARALGYAPDALRSRWPTTREERDLSLALSRVIAHEVLHAVLPGTSHADEGLTRPRLDRESLVAGSVSIDPAVAQAFREALGHRGAAAGSGGTKAECIQKR